MVEKAAGKNASRDAFHLYSGPASAGRINCLIFPFYYFPTDSNGNTVFWKMLLED